MTHRNITSSKTNKFEEGRALKVLQHLFPGKYKDAILADTPDIINKELSIGVEVTSCINPEVQAGVARVGDFSGKSIAELTERNLEQMRSDNIYASVLPSGQVMGVFTQWGSTHDVMRAYLSKVKKLNEPHFAVFSENNLLITAWMIDREDLNSGVEGLKKGLDGHFHERDLEGYTPFDIVYILTEGLLVEVNIEESTVRSHPIEQAQMDRIGHETFREVFGVSREEYYKE